MSKSDNLPITSWDKIPKEAQEALIEWYNISGVEDISDDKFDEDREILSNLYHSGNFFYGKCANPECEEEFRYGEPGDWGGFSRD